MPPNSGTGPPPDRAERLRLWRAGLAGVALAVPLGPLLGLIGVTGLAALLAVALVAVVLSVIGLAGPQTAFAAVLGLLTLAIPPFVASTLVDVRVLGLIPSLPLEEAARTRSLWIAGYRIDDAAPRLDLAAVVVVVRRGRRNAYHRTPYFVAPVLHPGARDAGAAAMWAVMPWASSAPEGWNAPGGGLRLLVDDRAHEAVTRAAGRLGVAAPEAPLALVWGPDPGAALRDAWLLLAGIVAGAGAVWSVLVFAPPRRRRPPARGPGATAWARRA